MAKSENDRVDFFEIALFCARAVAAEPGVRAATEDLATQAGLTVEAWAADRIQSLVSRLVAELPHNTSDDLTLFRKAVGDDMWATIAANPCLDQLATRYAREMGRKKINALLDQLVEVYAPSPATTAAEVRVYFHYTLTRRGFPH